MPMFESEHITGTGNTMVTKVARIAELEKKRANLGVGIIPQDGVTLGTTKEVLDHVIGVLEAAENLDKHPERIHVIK